MIRWHYRVFAGRPVGGQVYCEEGAADGAGTCWSATQVRDIPLEE